MAVPTLNPLWRSSPRDDRELIRDYALWPLSEYNLTQLTATMNRIAQVSPAAVTSVQGWIDEIETLEQNWADQVEDGTAHLGNVESYEGPTPGTTLTRLDRQTKADVLEWDSSLLKVKYQAGRRSDSTAGGVLHARVDKLKAKVFQTLGIKPYDGDGGSGSRLVRS
jgi:HAMP domain-containing protein